MQDRSFSWPTVVLVLGISIPTLVAIVYLSVNDKPTEAVLTTILALLAGLGVAQHTSTQKDLGKIQQQGETVVAQTNGQMKALMEQQSAMMDTIKDLALRVPAPAQVMPTSAPPAQETPEPPGVADTVQLGFVHGANI
jgi:hypothetical protein